MTSAASVPAQDFTIVLPEYRTILADSTWQFQNPMGNQDALSAQAKIIVRIIEPTLILNSRRRATVPD